MGTIFLVRMIAKIGVVRLLDLKIENHAVHSQKIEAR